VGITTVFVTHEQEEAFELGDRVALMNSGRLEQVGGPRELYDSPATRFAAGFIGRSSVVAGRWEKTSSRVRLPGGAGWTAVAGGDLPDGAPVELVVRPEALAFSTARDGTAAEGLVLEPRFAGRETYWAVALEGDAEVEVLAAPDSTRAGWKVFVAPAPGGPLPRAYPRSAE
jgi:spermidine/putrescine transport system ATP-binding protein